MSDEIEYLITCEVCGSETSVVVLNDDEKPAFCPMCGEICNPSQV